MSFVSRSNSDRPENSSVNLSTDPERSSTFGTASSALVAKKAIAEAAVIAIPKGPPKNAITPLSAVPAAVIVRITIVAAVIR